MITNKNIKMILEVVERVNGQSVSSSNQTAKEQPTSPCMFCSGNHWNDSCSKYPTAADRKQLLKYRCYICLKSGHRAFKCETQRACYFCVRKHHHHRSICEMKFETLQNGREQLGNMTAKHTEQSTTKASCNLQVVDSEDEVYRSQTSMEAELALTIQMMQKELENIKMKTYY